MPFGFLCTMAVLAERKRKGKAYRANRPKKVPELDVPDEPEMDVLNGAALPGEVVVKVEEFDGSYDCLICSESVRGTDARKCLACASPGTRNARLR